jgi:hypothetical protein
MTRKAAKSDKNKKKMSHLDKKKESVEFAVSPSDEPSQNSDLLSQFSQERRFFQIESTSLIIGNRQNSHHEEQEQEQQQANQRNEHSSPIIAADQVENLNNSYYLCDGLNVNSNGLNSVEYFINDNLTENYIDQRNLVNNQVDQDECLNGTGGRCKQEHVINMNSGKEILLLHFVCTNMKWALYLLTIDIYNKDDEEEYPTCSVVLENLSGSARTDYKSNHAYIEKYSLKRKQKQEELKQQRQSFKKVRSSSLSRASESLESSPPQIINNVGIAFIDDSNLNTPKRNGIKRRSPVVNGQKSLKKLKSFDQSSCLFPLDMISLNEQSRSYIEVESFLQAWIFF